MADMVCGFSLALSPVRRASSTRHSSGLRSVSRSSVEVLVESATRAHLPVQCGDPPAAYADEVAVDEDVQDVRKEEAPVDEEWPRVRRSAWEAYAAVPPKGLSTDPTSFRSCRA
jgi:hypothetical protein